MTTLSARGKLSAQQCQSSFGSAVISVTGSLTDPFSEATTGQASGGISCKWVSKKTRKSPSPNTEQFIYYNSISPLVISPIVCCCERWHLLSMEMEELSEAEWWCLWVPCSHTVPSSPWCPQPPWCSLLQGFLGSLSSFHLFPLFSPTSDPGFCEAQPHVCVSVGSQASIALTPSFHVPSWILHMVPSTHLWSTFGLGQQAKWRGQFTSWRVTSAVNPFLHQSLRIQSTRQLQGQ